MAVLESRENSLASITWLIGPKVNSFEFDSENLGIVPIEEALDYKGAFNKVRFNSVSKSCTEHERDTTSTSWITECCETESSLHGMPQLKLVCKSVKNVPKEVFYRL